MSSKRRGERVQWNALHVVVVGLWHLGSVAAGCLARLGHHVVGVDEDASRIARLREGRAPLFEPGLDKLLTEEIESGGLTFEDDFSDAVSLADVVLIAHDTTVTDQDEVDTSLIMRSVKIVAPLLRSDSLLIVHSQVPVGTSKNIRDELHAVESKRGCEVAYFPENLRLGQAIERFLHPDMLVVGAEDPRAYTIVDELFAAVDAPRVRTNLVTAEMAKHSINAFLATSISFGNEMANLCQTVGADARKIVEILRLERRVSPHAPLDPGMGFAGGTLARDMRILQAVGDANGYETHLIDGVLKVNEEQNSLPLRWLRQIYGSLPGLRVGVLGLTYKAGTSTLRRSASLEIVRKMLAEEVIVAATDPKADLGEADDVLEFEFSRDPYVVATGADALLLMTPWADFKTLDYERIRGIMRHPVLLDMQNALDRQILERLGFLCIGVGAGTPAPFDES